MDLDPPPPGVAVTALRAATARRLPSLIRPPKGAPIRRAITVVRVLGGALIVVLGRATQRRRQPGRPLSSHALAPRHSVRPTSSWARSSPAARASSPPSWCRNSSPAGPSAGWAFHLVRRVVESDLGASLESVFATFDESRSQRRRSAQVHGATLPRHPRRRQGAATDGGRPRA